jgi:hypothetical protein
MVLIRHDRIARFAISLRSLVGWIELDTELGRGRTMSLLTIEGVYKDGKIELDTPPAGIGGAARVLVTFLSPELARERDEQAREREQARLAAGERLMARLREGIPFGGPPYPKREERYDRVDRFNNRLDEANA